LEYLPGSLELLDQLGLTEFALSLLMITKIQSKSMIKHIVLVFLAAMLTKLLGEMTDIILELS